MNFTDQIIIKYLHAMERLSVLKFILQLSTHFYFSKLPLLASYKYVVPDFLQGGLWTKTSFQKYSDPAPVA